MIDIYVWFHGVSIYQKSSRLAAFLIVDDPCLVAHVWEKTHESRTLDRVCERSLILGSKASLATVENAGMWVQELRKDFRILVVDELDVVLVEIILLVHGSDN
jgi:hypothetical protein